MKQTTNYALKKIELTDSPPDVTTINPNWDIIDQELKENADQISSLSESKGQANGIATLGSNSKVPVAQLPDGTTSAKGVVQLSTSVTSTSTSVAATPSAVKAVNDKVESATYILDKIKTVDGIGSGLDADILRGWTLEEILAGGYQATNNADDWKTARQWTFNTDTLNKPANMSYGIIVTKVGNGGIEWNGSTNWVWQFAYSTDESKPPQMRQLINSGPWTPWKEVGGGMGILESAKNPIYVEGVYSNTTGVWGNVLDITGQGFLDMAIFANKPGGSSVQINMEVEMDGVIVHKGHHSSGVSYTGPAGFVTRNNIDVLNVSGNYWAMLPSNAFTSRRAQLDTATIIWAPRFDDVSRYDLYAIPDKLYFKERCIVRMRTSGATNPGSTHVIRGMKV